MSNKKQIGPLVSGVIIFLNGEDHIAEAIESVIAQTYCNWELILVDDGTTGSATDIAMRYADQRPGQIRYIEHPGHENRGMSASRNAGIREAKGDYVALLDADDIWMPERLQVHLDVLERHPNAVMSMGPTLMWSSWNRDALPASRPWLSADMDTFLGVPVDRVLEPPYLALNYLNSHGAGMPGICSLLIRREAIVEVGGFEDSFRRLYEDQVLLFKMFLSQRVIAVDTVLDKYRQHEGSSCHQDGGLEGDARMRPVFLEWLQTYMIQQGIADPELWRALRAELWRFDNPSAWRMANLPHAIVERWNAETRRAVIWLLTPKVYHRLRRRLGMRQIGMDEI